MTTLPIDNSVEQWNPHANLARNHLHDVRSQMVTRPSVIPEQSSDLLNLFNDCDSTLTGRASLIPVDHTYWQKHGSGLNQNAPQEIEVTRTPDQIAVLNLRNGKGTVMDTHGDESIVLNDHLVLLPQSNEGQIRVYEISDKKEPKSIFEWPKDLAHAWFNLQPLSVNKDGNVYYVSYGDRQSVKSLAHPGVTHYRMKSGTVRLSDDRSVALDWVADNKIVLINTQTWKEYFRMTMPFRIFDLRLSPNADYIAVKSEYHWWIVDVQNRFLKLVDGSEVLFKAWLGRDMFSVQTKDEEFHLRRAAQPRKVIAHAQYDENWEWSDEPFSFAQILFLHRNTINRNGFLYMPEWEEKKGKDTNEQ